MIEGIVGLCMAALGGLLVVGALVLMAFGGFILSQDARSQTTDTMSWLMGSGALLIIIFICVVAMFSGGMLFWDIGKSLF